MTLIIGRRELLAALGGAAAAWPLAARAQQRVRQISVCAFEKVQRAVRHRVAVMETPAPLLAQ